MAGRTEQAVIPGTPIASTSEELSVKRERASEHLNVTVALVERLTVELRQARVDERRARAALAAFYK